MVNYLLTKDGAEIDLIIDRPGETTLCIEIKSSEKVVESDLRNLIRLGIDIPKSKLFCLSREPRRKQIQNVLCMEWTEGISEIFQ